MTRLLGATPLLLLWALPLGIALVAFALSVFNESYWHALFLHPQLWPALGLSLWTGTASTLASLVLALIISAGLHRRRIWGQMQTMASAGLALPHLTFAIGFGFLIMPSGLVARVVVGGDAPPAWVSVQDPAGLSLIAALVLKEVPFLVAMIWNIMARGDFARSLDGQWRAARSLGHGAGSIWFRVVQPQILRRFIWPIVIVWVYGSTVVDMALVIGPTQPPTWAVAVWHDLNDVDPTINGRGAAGAVFLSIMLMSVGSLAAFIAVLTSRWLRTWFSQGPSLSRAPTLGSGLSLGLIAIIYTAVLAVLIVMAFAARWPYPQVWPGHFRLAAVDQLLSNPAPLLLSIGLGLAVTIAALMICVVWFETQAQRHDRWFLWFALAALALPQLLVASGQYRALLTADLTASLPGLFLVHLTPVLAYAVIVLTGPYRAFDERYAAVARSLRAGSAKIWWRVKAPLLRGPLLTAAAVGFAVSMVQFVPAQLVAAGRYATLPMEAVTLSSGGNRSLTATYALAMTLPPLLGFAIAGLAGRPRWR